MIDSPPLPELKKLFPFQSRYFKTGRYKIHYVDEGSGPVLLLMHACPMWTFAFRDLIWKFRKNHRVVALDQMGFGLSDKPLDFDYRLENHTAILESLIRSLELHNITFIMHGRGSTIGMAYAVRNPENVRAFVTLNAMAFSDFRLPLRLQICRIKWLGAKIVMGIDLFTREIKHMPPDVRECYEQPLRSHESKNAQLRFIEDIPTVPEDESAQSMLEIESSLWMLRAKPSAIIWAKKDWLYTSKCYEKWKQYFPEAELYKLDSAGRYLSEDAPTQLASILTEFLRRYQC